MTQEPTPRNGGREQSYLDTLTPQQRDLVHYVRGMPENMQSAWTISQISGIHSTLEDFTKKALLAQSTATNEALAAANPPKVKGLSPAASTFLAGAGVVLGGVLYAVAQRWA